MRCYDKLIRNIKEKSHESETTTRRGYPDCDGVFASPMGNCGSVILAGLIERMNTMLIDWELYDRWADALDSGQYRI